MIGPMIGPKFGPMTGPSPMTSDRDSNPDLAAARFDPSQAAVAWCLDCSMALPTIAAARPQAQHLAWTHVAVDDGQIRAQPRFAIAPRSPHCPASQRALACWPVLKIAALKMAARASQAIDPVPMVAPVGEPMGKPMGKPDRRAPIHLHLPPRHRHYPHHRHRHRPCSDPAVYCPHQPSLRSQHSSISQAK